MNRTNRTRSPAVGLLAAAVLAAVSAGCSAEDAAVARAGATTGSPAISAAREAAFTETEAARSATTGSPAISAAREAAFTETEAARSATHAHGAGQWHRRAGEDLATARAASANRHRVEDAEADGFALPPAPAPLHECISDTSGHGAMGLHYINAANIDAELHATLPEVLVYEPTRNGRLRLVALEYVVFEDAWQAEHGDSTPQLFGRDLTYVGEGNRYQLPPFYQIHAWVWKHNPNGTFADHNPRVTCPAATDSGVHEHPPSPIAGLPR